MAETWSVIFLARSNMDDHMEHTYFFKDEELWPSLREGLESYSEQAEALVRIASNWGERWSARAKELGCTHKDIARAEKLAPILAARDEERVNHTLLEPPRLVSHVYTLFTLMPAYSRGDGDDLDNEWPGEGEGGEE